MSATSRIVRMFDVFSMIFSALYGVRTLAHDALFPNWRRQVQFGILGATSIEERGGHRFRPAPRMPNANRTRALSHVEISSAMSGRIRPDSSAVWGWKLGILGGVYTCSYLYENR